MMASALLEWGPEHLERVLEEMENWMEEYEYESVRQMQGSMAYRAVREPSAYERANYMKVLQSIK